MPTGRVITVIRTLVREPDDRPDGDLLNRFVAERDGAAFAELVRRHGRMVFGVCRRVLGHDHDAEDAFQAVWLVLARRAADVRPPGSVGPWLYGVAVRTAGKARALAMKRRRRQLAAARPEAVEDRPACDLGPVLDEELARLPGRYRAAVVACDLGGKSRSVAARDLGWPEGTVAARLAKARQLLAARLSRRGVTLSVAGLATVAVEPPQALAASAVNAALEFAAGSALVPPLARTLAEGVMRSMIAGKVKLWVVGVVMAATLAGGAALIARPGAAPGDRPAPEPAPKQARHSAEVWREAKVINLPGWLAGSLAYAPDGKALLIGGSGHVAAYDAATWNEQWKANVGGRFSAATYSPDAKTVAATFADGVRFLDAATGKAGDTLEEKGSSPRAVAYIPDVVQAPGAVAPVQPSQPVWLNHKVIFGNASGYFVKVWLEWPKVSTITTRIMPDGKEPADPYAIPLAVAPDGKRVVVTGPIDRATGKNVLWAWSAGSGAGNQLLKGHKAIVTAAAWSKDGKTLLTGDAGGTVIQWDGTTFKEKRRLQLGGRIASLALTTNGKRAAAAVVGPQTWKGHEVEQEVVYVWDNAGPVERLPPSIHRRILAGPFAGVASVAFSPDGESLAAAFCNFDQLDKLNELVGKVRIWTRADGHTPATAKSGGIGGKPSKYEHVELEKFQGIWRLDQFDGPSGKLTAGEVKKLDWTMTFNGNKYQITQRGEITNYGRIAVDTTQKPPVLIRISTDRERDGYVWCLYEIEGDTLRLCQETLGKGRPSEFKVTPSQTIAVYKRQKP
jgi:RNA polymerase sigma factor (sigma-70 family)